MRDLIIKFRFKENSFFVISLLLHIIFVVWFFNLKLQNDVEHSYINITLNKVEESYALNEKIQKNKNMNENKINKNHLKVEKKEIVKNIESENLEKIEEVEEILYDDMLKANLLNDKSFNKMQNKKPYYPMIARQKKWQGIVMVKIFLDKNGKINEITLAKSSGYKILDESALGAVKQWVFVNNYNKNIYVVVPFEFKLQ